MGGMVSTAEMKNDNTPYIDASLVTTEPIVISSFQMQKGKRIGGITTCLQVWNTGDCRTSSESLGNAGGHGY